jgi:hypothetical protein
LTSVSKPVTLPSSSSSSSNSNSNSNSSTSTSSSSSLSSASSLAQEGEHGMFSRREEKDSILTSLD